MSYFICHRCGERHEIFRHGGGERCAKELGVPFLGAIPLDPAVALQGDLGEPIVHSHPDSPIAQAYLTLASAVKAQVESMQSELAELPTLEFQ